MDEVMKRNSIQRDMARVIHDERLERMLETVRRRFTKFYVKKEVIDFHDNSFIRDHTIHFPDTYSNKKIGLSTDTRGKTEFWSHLDECSWSMYMEYVCVTKKVNWRKHDKVLLRCLDRARCLDAQREMEQKLLASNKGERT
jgi:hypothetical protein